MRPDARRRKTDRWVGQLKDQRVPIGWGIVVCGAFVASYLYLHENFTPAVAGGYTTQPEFRQHQQDAQRAFAQYQRENQIFVMQRDLRILDRQIRELEGYSRLSRNEKVRLRLLREDREWLRENLLRMQNK